MDINNQYFFTNAFEPLNLSSKQLDYIDFLENNEEFNQFFKQMMSPEFNSDQYLSIDPAYSQPQQESSGSRKRKNITIESAKTTKSVKINATKTNGGSRYWKSEDCNKLQLAIDALCMQEKKFKFKNSVFKKLHELVPEITLRSIQYHLGSSICRTEKECTKNFQVKWENSLVKKGVFCRPREIRSAKNPIRKEPVRQHYNKKNCEKFRDAIEKVAKQSVFSTKLALIKAVHGQYFSGKNFRHYHDHSSRCRSGEECHILLNNIIKNMKLRIKI